jgi:hypothetical protein
LIEALLDTRPNDVQSGAAKNEKRRIFYSKWRDLKKDKNE